MTVDADEFQRRLLIHVLPGGFQRTSGITAIWPTASAKKNWTTVRTILAAGITGLLPQPEQCRQMQEGAH